MNKYKLYMIIGISTLVLSISTTFAYYIWKSSTNAIVNLEVCTPTITFAGGSTINGVDILPVLSKEDGTIKDIEVSKKGTCTKDVTMNLYLELTTFPTELADSSFKYELYKNNSTTPVANGNFANKKEGDTITLLSNTIVASDKDTYTLYIYIDGNMDNPLGMAGKSFLFKVWGAGEGAIYKENVMQNETTTPSSSSSTFLNTSVLRSQIQSITIERNNEIPNDVKYSKDISSNQDGSVILWYTDKDNNGLYEVSIGGANGRIEANTSGSNMFAYLDNVETLDLTGLDTSNMTSMTYMFYNSKSLKSINLSDLNTSKLLYANNMFNGCNSLESIDLSSFNTSKVTNLSNMFKDCTNLREINLTNFNTSSTKQFTGMFFNCKSLKKLDLSSFNTKNAIYIGGMFYNCSSLTELDLSSFDTSNVTNMGYGMFYNCSSLKKIDLSSFNTSKVTDLSDMFNSCSSLETINLSNFDTSNVTNMANMFYNCKSLKEIDLSNFNTSNVTNMYKTFMLCSNVKNIYVSNLWNTSKVTNSTFMFNGCTSLNGSVPYDVSKVDASMANYTNGYLTYKNNN